MKSDRRITLITAVATFVGLTALTVLVWALKTPDTPAPMAAAVEASALPAGHPQIESATFDRIDVADLKPLVDAGNVVLIDVRSAEQFVAGHIGGAMHIPVASIEGEIEFLPKDKLVVTYCTCPNEESSGEAALILQSHGRLVKALAGGLGAWTTAGFPTVAGVK